MPDLLWSDVEDWFDPDMNGTLPDVCVPDAGAADWTAVFDLIRSRGWAYQYSEDNQPMRIPADLGEIFNRDTRPSVMLKVWPDRKFLAIFWLLDITTIDFDVDIRELQGQDQLDHLCRFLRTIGRRLHKPVLLSPEGYTPTITPILGYNVTQDRVILLREHPKLTEQPQHGPTRRKDAS